MSKVRKIGRRGQVTIPKDIREREGLKGGDKVEFEEKEDEIVIKRKKDLEEELKKGYKDMSEKSKKVSEEMIQASEEAEEMID